MPTLPVPRLDDLNANFGAHLQTRFPSKAHDTDSFFGKLRRAIAMFMLGFIKLLAYAYRNAVPGYDNTQDGAAAWASAWGIPSNNPANRYGPNIARPAAGGVGTATGTPTSAINDGTDLVDSTGQVFFKTSGNNAVESGGTVSVNIIAVTPGRSGNIGPPQVLQFVIPPTGVQIQVALTTALGGGEDDEAKDSVTDRTLIQARRPKRGGSAADFRRWCENYLTEQAIPGGLVRRAWVYALRGGVGTVHIVIGGGGSGLSRLLTLAIAATVKAYLDLVRPVTSRVSVLLPDMSRPGKSVVVFVQPVPTRKYQFDTIELFLGVVSITDGTKIIVDDNIATSAAPGAMALKTAIDRGAKPRIQVQATAQRLPMIVRAVAYTNAANSTLTLETSTAVPAPTTGITAGDPLHAGSYVVLPIAQAISDMVDALGPSRQSGYADPFDGWNDTLTVGAIEGAAMGAVDPADTRVKLLANITNTSIDGSTAPVVPRDVLPLTGTPELLYLKNGGLVILPMS